MKGDIEFCVNADLGHDEYASFPYKANDGGTHPTP